MSHKKEQTENKCLHCTACSNCEAIYSYKLANKIVNDLVEIYSRTSDLCVAKAITLNFIREWQNLNDNLMNNEFIKECIKN